MHWLGLWIHFLTGGSSRGGVTFGGIRMTGAGGAALVTGTGGGAISIALGRLLS